MRLHDLRHSAVALLIGQGVSSRAISELLGHSSVAFTLQVYGHLLEETKRETYVDPLADSRRCGSSTPPRPARCVSGLRGAGAPWRLNVVPIVPRWRREVREPSFLATASRCYLGCYLVTLVGRRISCKLLIRWLLR
jgi:hypothetical protein